MKQLYLIALVVVLAGTFWGCVSGNKSKQIKDYKYTEEKTVNDSVLANAETWAAEGMTCYGIVIMLNAQGRAKKVKEIEAKIVLIEPGLIKMKAMENLAMAPVQGCNKMEIKMGETWTEKEGELFRTREEAVKFITKNYPGLQFDNY